MSSFIVKLWAYKVISGERSLEEVPARLLADVVEEINKKTEN